LAEAITEISTAYQKETGTKATPVFAGSNVLARQIEEGAPLDIFLSADEATMDKLAKANLVKEPKGLLTNALVTPIVGLAIIEVVSGLQQRQKTTAAVAAICAFLALILVAGFALFVLDYLQLRTAVGMNARGPYDSAAFKAMIVAALESGVLLWLAITGFRASGITDAAKGRRRGGRVGLVVQVEEERGA